MRGLGGGHPAAQQKHLHRDVMGNAAWKALQCARVRHNSQGHFGQPEFHMIRCDQQITAHCHLEPAANRQPVDRGNHRFVKRPVFGEASKAAEAVFVSLPPVIKAHLAIVKRLEVPACRKDLVPAAR